MTPSGKAVGITLAPGPGRIAALLIVGVPLAILLTIGFITAPGDGSSLNGYDPNGAGSYPVVTATTPADGDPVVAPTPGDPLATTLSDTPTLPVTPTAPGLGSATMTSPVTASSTPASVPPTATPTGPAATVLAAYADINRHDYAAAFAIGLGNPQPDESLQQYAAGYAYTASVAVTVTQVQGNTVWVTLHATQTNGTQQEFMGWYAVADNHITSADIGQTDEG